MTADEYFVENLETLIKKSNNYFNNDSFSRRAIKTVINNNVDQKFGMFANCVDKDYYNDIKKMMKNKENKVSYDKVKIETAVIKRLIIEGSAFVAIDEDANKKLTFRVIKQSELKMGLNDSKKNIYNGIKYNKINDPVEYYCDNKTYKSYDMFPIYLTKHFVNFEDKLVSHIRENKLPLKFSYRGLPFLYPVIMDDTRERYFIKYWLFMSAEIRLRTKPFTDFIHQLNDWAIRRSFMHALSNNDKFIEEYKKIIKGGKREMFETPPDEMENMALNEMGQSSTIQSCSDLFDLGLITDLSLIKNKLGIPEISKEDILIEKPGKQTLNKDKIKKILSSREQNNGR